MGASDYQRQRYARRIWAQDNLSGFQVTPESANTPLPIHGPRSAVISQHARAEADR